MNKYCGVFLLALCTATVACSSRFEPAPVEILSTRIASQNNLTEILTDTYTVQAGDTLFAIAFYSGNSYREIAEINNISAPYEIRIGQTLNLKPPPISTEIKQKRNTEQSLTKSTQVVVDPPTTQAYGRTTQEKHRKVHQKTPDPSIQLNKNRWIWPAKGPHKVATVGTDGSSRGLDIKGRLGSEILAAQSGKVVYAGNALKGYGNLVIIKHDDEYLSAYAHNDKILVGEQTYVEQGQKIATMGQSGASEVMLHFEIRKKGKSRDPFLYLLKD